jgi:hypothetical protein
MRLRTCQGQRSCPLGSGSGRDLDDGEYPACLELSGGPDGVEDEPIAWSNGWTT